MDSREENHIEWEAIRGRVDSLSNAVFIIAGGALSVSISVMVGVRANGPIPIAAAQASETAWWSFLSTILLFITLKCHLILQAFLLHTTTRFADKYNGVLNTIGWVLGVLGVGTLALGLVQIVCAASIIVLS